MATVKKEKVTKEKERIALSVVDIAGKEVEKVELDPKVFDGKVKTGSIYNTIKNFRANNRSGTASTKTRAEVAGSGKKLWKQKGTGRARVGSVRTPTWRHGGVVFGPQPRDCSYVLPRKVKQLALRSVLNSRVSSNDVVILNTLMLDNYKTKSFMEILKKLKLKDKILLVNNSFNENIERSSRNIANLKVVEARNLNAYDVLSFNKLVITKDALKTLTDRLK